MRIPNQSKGQVRSTSRTKWVGSAGLYFSTRIPLSFAPRPVIPESPGDYGNCVAACQFGGGSTRDCLNSCL